METIKVQFVNQPKEGKKKGSIKTEDGRYFDVWPNMLSQFSRGESYEITTESREWQGKQYYTIKTAAQVHGNGSTPAPTNGNGSVQRGEDYNVSRWQTCLQVSGRIMAGNAVPANQVIEFARELYASTPTPVTDGGLSDL